MRVRLKVDLSGTRDGQPWPRRGETADLPDHEAADLCAAGLAIAVTDEPEAAVDATNVENAIAPPAETAVAESAAAETAAVKRPRGRPRQTKAEG